MTRKHACMAVYKRTNTAKSIDIRIFEGKGRRKHVSYGKMHNCINILAQLLFRCGQQSENRLCYNAIMEITLEQLLAAKDARAEMISALRRRFPGACVAVLTVVSPGPVKRSPETIRLFDAAVSAIGRVILKNELVPLLFEAHEKETGDEAYLVVKTEPGFLKMELCKLEEATSYGRLWDMDVIRPDGKRIDREDVGFAQRRCFVCAKPGRDCYSRRLHTEQEVRAAYQTLVNALPQTNDR